MGCSCVSMVSFGAIIWCSGRWCLFDRRWRSACAYYTMRPGVLYHHCLLPRVDCTLLHTQVHTIIPFSTTTLSTQHQHQTHSNQLAAGVVEHVLLFPPSLFVPPLCSAFYAKSAAARARACMLPRLAPCRAIVKSMHGATRATRCVCLYVLRTARQQFVRGVGGWGCW